MSMSSACTRVRGCRNSSDLRSGLPSVRPDSAAGRVARRDLVVNAEPVSRRALSLGSGLMAMGTLIVQESKANPLQDLARGLIREEVTPEQAVATLVDADYVLGQIQKVAASPADSELRFKARALWPGWATRLRAVGSAAPIVVGIVTGAVDSEATLSYEYGGKAGDQPGAADALYVGLGRVLTISGRTIRPEAQASPDNAKEAQDAIKGLLAKVPADLLKTASFAN